MQIPDLSIASSAPAARSARSRGDSPDGFAEALEALLGEVDELTLSMAAAAAVPGPRTLTPSPAPLPPAPAPVGTVDAAAGRLVASLVLDGLPTPASSPILGAALEGPVVSLPVESAAGGSDAAAATMAQAPVPDATVMADAPVPDPSTVVEPAPAVVPAEAPVDRTTIVPDPGGRPGADPGSHDVLPQAAADEGRVGPAEATNDIQPGQSGGAPHGGGRDAAGDPNGRARATDHAPSHAAVHTPPTPPPGLSDEPISDASRAERLPATASESAPISVDRGVGIPDPTPVAPGAAGHRASALPTAPAQVDRALVDAVRQLREGREESRHMVLHLDPPELGAVNVRLVVRGDEVQLTMHSANGDARAALTDQRSSIQDAFTAAGLELHDFDITGGEPERRDQAHDDRRTTSRSGLESLAPDDAETDGALRL